MQHLELDHAEQDRLAVLAKAGDRHAAGLLVQSLVKWITLIAWRKAGRRSRMVEDLVAEGMEGVLLAVRNFDPGNGTSFFSFATYQIKARMTRWLHLNTRPFSMSTNRHARALWSKLPEVQKQCASEGIACTSEVVASRTGIPLAHVKAFMRAYRQRDLSLDESRDGLSVVDLPVKPVVEDQDLRNRIGEELTAFGQELTGRDAEIFYLRIMAEDPESLESLGDRHGISRERIRQLEKKIRTKLQAWLRHRIPGTRSLLLASLVGAV